MRIKWIIGLCAGLALIIGIALFVYQDVSNAVDYRNCTEKYGYYYYDYERI